MPLLKRVKQLVSQATFKIGDQERGFGQCVMVEGGFLITAAHCVMRACDAKRPGARQYDEFNAITTDSGTYTARTLAFEPVSDVAILRCPDDQAWAQWCASITPLKVQKQAPKLGAKFDVWIWTHEKNWIAGKAMILADPPASFGIMLDTEIPPGTSGGPS